MKTAGYDVLVEINERLVNHLLAAAYYTSFYTKFEGTVVPNMGGAFGDLVKVDYVLVLKEPPLIDFSDGDKVMARLNVEATIKVIGRKVRTDVAADLMGRMRLDPVGQEVNLEVLDVKLRELRFLDRFDLPAIARMAINQALVVAIRSNFMGGMAREGEGMEVDIPASMVRDPVRLGDEVKIFLLPGFPGMTIKVPTIGVQVSSLVSMVPTANLDIGQIEVPVFPGFFGVVNDQSIAVAVAMGENLTGDPSSVKDFTEGHDMAIGLSEASLNRILDQVWSQLSREVKVEGNIPVDNVKELLDSLQGIRDMPSRFNTLGLSQKNTEIEKANIVFSAVVNPQKPKIRFGEGGMIELYDTHVKGRAKADVKATKVTTLHKGRNVFMAALVGPKEAKPPEIKKEEVSLYNFDSDMEIFLRRAVVNLVADGEGRLKINVADVDFSLSIPWHLPKFVFDQISKRIEDTIKKEFPAIDVTKLIEERITPIIPFGPELKIAKISTEGSEAVVLGDIGFKQMPTRIIPVPSFVADMRNAVREVHRHDCPSIHRIPESSQVGYTTLYDALADGLKGAKDCLPEFKEGMKEKERTVTIPEVEIPLAMPAQESAPKKEEAVPIPIVSEDNSEFH